MGDVFILGDYGKLGRHNEHLMYTNHKGETQNILPFKTDMIILSGAVTITAEGFQILAKNKIPVYFQGRGNSSIRFDYGQSKNIFLRQQQFRIIDSSKGLEISKNLVLGKLHNQIEFLKRQKRNFKSPQLNNVINKLNTIQTEVSMCESVERLRGYEGIAAKDYFSVFDLMLKPDWAVFGTRSKNPPKTNVNAVLSYIYSVLMCRIQRVLESLGLDTMVSTLHELAYGKETLSYDLVEEFRSSFADPLCIKLFNKGILCEQDFTKKDGGMYLTDEGCAKVIAGIQEKLDSEVMYKPEEKKLTFSQIIIEQCQIYKNMILGEIPQYRPFAL